MADSLAVSKENAATWTADEDDEEMSGASTCTRSRATAGAPKLRVDNRRDRMSSIGSSGMMTKQFRNCQREC